MGTRKGGQERELGTSKKKWRSKENMLAVEISEEVVSIGIDGEGEGQKGESELVVNFLTFVNFLTYVLELNFS